MMRRIGVFSLGFLVLLAGCGKSGKSAETSAVDTSHPVRGDWAVVRFEGEPDNLNPLITQQTAAFYAMLGANNSQIYELLIGYDPKDWSLTKPLLVEGLPDVSEDHLVYTFKIRDGVKWHDGQLFTADDVLFTFKAAACPLADTAALRSYLTDLKDIQMDGLTIRFIMSKPNVYNVGNIANILAIIPKHVYDS